ncbi:hypothetical protein ASG52_10190 [Methylobacterium sp. Leaf456]|uniref:M10 family metallopeptidase C-terminal domain-containing protein n=1 Tax=Methylobacterium sp. Leaf456 TaxID=1736382 RepID=UPI0006FB3523|nr:M10 family metallopeptidase C-terminal domain-containing protein [Methylobacterium sp. Leaf456]KQT49317.1 hypothetical protein ASG52_10190 [Methylobacterium sp. Leaf456]
MVDLFKPVALTGNAVIDSLIGGGAWNTERLTYGFKTQDIDRNGVSDFNEGDWKAFYEEIFDQVSTFARLDFSEAPAAEANLVQRLDVGGGGESGGPGPGVTTIETAVGIDPTSVKGAADVVRLGTYSETWLHEIGHSLGLKHTHDIDAGPPLPGVVGPADKGTGNLNSQIYSVMGYTYPFFGEDNPFTLSKDVNTALNAQPGSFGAIDIAALQHLYGARAHNVDNNVYRFSDDVDADRGYTTIWDTGGIDTIAYEGGSRAKIDLRAATLKAEIGGGGWLSTSETLTGGFTIANGVVIENATGGSRNDILIGNAASNTLDGRGGADRMSGLSGDDLYAVDHKSDFVVEAVGGGRDTVVSTVSTALRAGQEIEVLRAAHDKSLALTGNAFDQEIVGRAGKDFLDGKGGNDTLTGGGRADTFVFSTALGADNVDRITDFSHRDDVIRLDDAVFRAIGVGTLEAGAFKDLARPGAAADADDRILYDGRTGEVFYDADGSEAGARTLFAVLTNKAAIDHTDFLIV